jgi:hypothetical protein
VFCFFEISVIYTAVHNRKAILWKQIWAPQALLSLGTISHRAVLKSLYLTLPQVPPFKSLVNKENLE